MEVLIVAAFIIWIIIVSCATGWAVFEYGPIWFPVGMIVTILPLVLLLTS